MWYLFSILIFLVILLAIIGVVTAKGIPLGLEIAIDSFLDSYEYIDFDAAGRIKYDYQRWMNRKATLNANGHVKFAHPKSFMNWGTRNPLPIHFEFVDFEIPDGMEIEMKLPHSSSVFVPGYTMTLLHQGEVEKEFSFQIILKQIDNNLVFDKPVQISFSIEAYFNVKRLFFLQASKRKKIKYQFFIGPDLEDTWVAFDPGTSGSCIATGNPNSPIILETIDGKEKVTPSIITFNKKLQPENLYTADGKINKKLYNFGVDASAEKGLERNASFQSVKKLLGYLDEKRIEYLNGENLTLNGVVLSSLLVEGVYEDLKTFIEANKSSYKSILSEGNFSPNRAVVAIPNNFTAPKIIDMLKCIEYLKQFKEIRYITEAEAVLCYYIHQHSRLHPDSEKGLEDETVLIFDMGGATINTTIADVTLTEGDRGSTYEIDIDAKIGYGIGGDTIDYCLAKTIFSFSKDYPLLKLYDPFKGKNGGALNGKKASPRGKKSDLQSILFDLKLLIIERFYKKPLIIKKANNPKEAQKSGENIYEKYFVNSGEYKVLLTPGELSKVLSDIIGEEVEVSEKEKIYRLFVEDYAGNFPLFKNTFFQEYIYGPILESIRDTVELSEGNAGYLDTVIFSGRSCMFPLVKETVEKELLTVKNTKAKLDQEFISPSYINLDGDELKTAVVKGACWYGIHNNTVKLSPLKVSSSFGVVRTRSANKKDIEFYSLIEIGAAYQNDPEGAFVESFQPVNDIFQFDGGYVNFYQVMGKDPLEILRKEEKHKYSRIGSIKINSKTKEVGTVITAADKVDCKVLTSNQEELRQSNIVAEQEVGDANEEHYTWIVN